MCRETIQSMGLPERSAHARQAGEHCREKRECPDRRFRAHQLIAAAGFPKDGLAVQNGRGVGRGGALDATGRKRGRAEARSGAPLLAGGDAPLRAAQNPGEGAVFDGPRDAKVVYPQRQAGRPHVDPRPKSAAPPIGEFSPQPTVRLADPEGAFVERRIAVHLILPGAHDGRLRLRGRLVPGRRRTAEGESSAKCEQGQSDQNNASHQAQVKSASPWPLMPGACWRKEDRV